MSKVIRRRSWSSWSELGGKRLKQGEKLRLEWPNGRVTEEEIIIQKWSEECSDHGHSSSYPQERAMVAVSNNGVQNLISIEGLDAVRV